MRRSPPATAILTALVLGTLAGVPRPVAAAPTPAVSPIEVSGATRAEYDDAAQEWVFRGTRVVVVRGTLRIAAPLIRYNAVAHLLEVASRGTVTTPTLEVAADRMTASLATRHVTAAGNVAGRYEDGPAAPPAGPADWTTFSADAVELDDRPDARRFVATGRVVVVRRDQELRGDRVAYDRVAEQGAIDGHAEVIRGTSRLFADHVRTDQGRGTAQADDHVVLEQEEMRGVADHATYTRDTQTTVLLGHVTVTRGRDVLTADRATVRLDQHTAVAEGAPARIVVNAATPEAPTP
jgi:lipopolysaccharide export system protein LptA